MLIHCLTLWQEFCVHNAPDIKNAISISFTLDSNCLAFFGLGDPRLFHWRLCHLVSGSYSKIQDSSPVITFYNKFGSVWRSSRMSWHTCSHQSFWSLFSSFGTIFAHSFLISKSSVIIFQTVSQLMPNSYATICTVI